MGKQETLLPKRKNALDQNANLIYFAGYSDDLNVLLNALVTFTCLVQKKGRFSGDIPVPPAWGLAP
jgi:hypothetical protein